MVMDGLITSFSKNRLGVFRSKNASISVSIVSVNWHNIICFKKLVLLLLLSNIIIIVFENIGKPIANGTKAAANGKTAMN